jgi:hypothetical protein
MLPMTAMKPRKHSTGSMAAGFMESFVQSAKSWGEALRMPSDAETKAAQIMILHRRGHSTRAIALAVYDLVEHTPQGVIEKAMAYVRVVTRQRRGHGESKADVRWRNSAQGRAMCNAKKNRQRAKHRISLS